MRSFGRPPGTRPSLRASEAPKKNFRKKSARALKILGRGAENQIRTLASATEKGNPGGDPLSAKPMGLGSKTFSSRTEKAGLPV